jgi:hypothetical protein
MRMFLLHSSDKHMENLAHEITFVLRVTLLILCDPIQMNRDTENPNWRLVKT